MLTVLTREALKSSVVPHFGSFTRWTWCIRPTLRNTPPLQEQHKCKIGQSRVKIAVKIDSVGEFLRKY